AGEGPTEVLALSENGQPGEPRLEPLEAKLLEKPHIIGDRPTPLMVVIGDIVGQPCMPGAGQPPPPVTDQPALAHRPSPPLQSFPFCSRRGHSRTQGRPAVGVPATSVPRFFCMARTRRRAVDS